MTRALALALASGRSSNVTPLLAIVVAMVAHPAAAEQPAPVPIPAGGVESDIIVTAQRRSQSVQEIPAAITALSQVQLEQRGITDIGRLQYAVPSLTLGRSLGVTQVAIRGVGRTVGEPGVAINIDGVYQPRNIPMIIAQTDLDRVEVLRGPQGTLYGRNANGGAVNFISAAPTADLGGYVQASVATYGEYHLQGVLNVPITDWLRVRAAVDYQDRTQGFVKNVAGGPDLDTLKTLVGRVRIDADLTDNLTLDLNLDAFHGSGKQDYYVLVGLPNAASIAANPYLVNANIPLQSNRTSALGNTGSNRDFQSATATINWKINAVTVKSITSYQHISSIWDQDRDGVDLPIVDSRAVENSNTVSQEVNFSGKTGPIDWVGGVYFFDDHNATNTFYAFQLGFAPLPPGFFLRQELPKYATRSYAGYADVTGNVTDRLRLIGGIRYSNDKIDVIHHNFIGLIAGQVPLLDTCPLEDDKLDFGSVTYRAGGQFDVADNKHLYLTTSTGFKAGGVNTSGCLNTFRPEKITSYEGGLKSRFLDNRLTLNLSAFHYDYSDFQLTQVVGIAGRVTNAASAKLNGLEIETQFNADGHWSFNGSLSLLDAKFGSFSSVDSLNPQLGVQNLRGRSLAYAPKVSGNAGVAYTTSIQGFGTVTGRVDISARSKTYFREFNQPIEAQAAYAVANLNFVWDSEHGRYRARLFANNIFNKGYYVSMLAIDGFGTLAGTFGEPRQIGIEVRRSF